MRKKKDILRIMMFIYSTLFYLCRKQRYENNMNPLFDKPFTFDRVIRIDNVADSHGRSFHRG